MSNFKTLAKTSTGELKDRGSKFIAYATPIFSDKEAKDFIQELWKEHHKARHICYAYSIGTTSKIIRTNDDGEPNNTGGQPILNYIKKYELDNVLIAVVRYFGGVLLGKGGLINAYGGAAHEALKNAEFILQSEKLSALLVCSFESYPTVIDILKNYEVTIINEEYSENCKLSFSIDKDRYDPLSETLQTSHLIKIKKLE